MINPWLASLQAAVSEQLRLKQKSGATGALGAVWQTQKAKERTWLDSLLFGLNEDAGIPKSSESNGRI